MLVGINTDRQMGVQFFLPSFRSFRLPGEVTLQRGRNCVIASRGVA